MTKEEAYCNLLKLFVKMTQLSKTKSNKGHQAKKNLGVEMMLIGMNIALLGSDDVIEYYLNWRAATLTGKTELIVERFSMLMLAMRKDLRDTELKSYEKMTEMYVEVKDETNN